MQNRRRPPAYALYGEAGEALLDRLHVESIAERSRLHDWEIRPHRHAGLAQLLVVRHGGAEAWLDGRRVALRGPAVVTVPARAEHGFRFEPAIEGWVFTLAEAPLAALLAPHPALRAALLLPRGTPLLAGADAVLAAAQALHDEARGDAPHRAAALDAALLRLAVAVARHAPPAPRAAPARPPSPAAGHVQRLQALVEAQFRRQPAVAALAAEIGITPTQLNRACRQVLGHGALAVLHGRLMRQAQRELAYTNLSIKQIALDLGFSDAAYFTRFFRRHGGHSPSGWREACMRT